MIHAYDAVRRWRADIVHDHTLVGPVYAQRFDVPVVTTNHGPFDGELGALYRAIAGTVPVIAISARSSRRRRRHPGRGGDPPRRRRRRLPASATATAAMRCSSVA